MYNHMLQNTVENTLLEKFMKPLIVHPTALILYLQAFVISKIEEFLMAIKIQIIKQNCLDNHGVLRHKQ